MRREEEEERRKVLFLFPAASLSLFCLSSSFLHCCLVAAGHKHLKTKVLLLPNKHKKRERNTYIREMSLRLKQTFEQKSAQKRPVFVGFVTAGYPTLEATVPVLLGLQAGGADVIELGIPHTDPLADGPTIQHSDNGKWHPIHLF